MSLESEADSAGEAALPGALPEALRAELVAFRRDLHMHPELGNQEFRTTAAIKERLERAGLKPRVLAVGTGLVCDIGEWDGGRPMLALRADIDGLPIPDTKTDVPVPLHRARPRARLRSRRAHHRRARRRTGPRRAAPQGRLPRPCG